MFKYFKKNVPEKKEILMSLSFASFSIFEIFLMILSFNFFLSSFLSNSSILFIRNRQVLIKFFLKFGKIFCLFVPNISIILLIFSKVSRFSGTLMKIQQLLNFKILL